MSNWHKVGIPGLELCNCAEIRTVFPKILHLGKRSFYSQCFYGEHGWANSEPFGEEHSIQIKEGINQQVLARVSTLLELSGDS